MTPRGAADKQVFREPASSRVNWPVDVLPEAGWKSANRIDVAVRPDGNPEPYRVVLRCGMDSDR